MDYNGEVTRVDESEIPEGTSAVFIMSLSRKMYENNKEKDKVLRSISTACGADKYTERKKEDGYYHLKFYSLENN